MYSIQRILINLRLVMTVMSLMCVCPRAEAQSGTIAEALESDDDGPLVRDGGSGYIDNAIIGNQFRLRYDGAYENRQPARAEYFWAVDAAFGPGPGPETSVDYQDFRPYLELQLHSDLSVFAEVPFRLVNPELLDNTGGLADSNFGFKYSLHQCHCHATTFQFRVHTPTGDVERGLGNNLVALEPALLSFWRLSDRTNLYAEVSDWISLNGTPTFAGNVLRYGIGGSHLLNDSCCYPLSAVVEVVGWTVLEGRTAITTLPVATQFPDATGDTIVNTKLGARLGLGHQLDLYAGYGFAVTHEAWYDDIFRFELRHSF